MREASTRAVLDGCVADMARDSCRASPSVKASHSRHTPQRQFCLDHSLGARVHKLLVVGWRIVILTILARRLSTCFQLPARSVVLAGSNFVDILQRRTVAADVFKGVPLATFTSRRRGEVLERLVREIDTARNPSAVVSDPELDASSSKYRPASSADYDWLRGAVRVECKSAQLRWSKASRGGHWRVTFRGVKFAFGRVCVAHQFDELYLALYTPAGIYVYRHDFEFGVCTNGRSTNVSGHGINVCGPVGEQDWNRALRSILSKMNSSSCEFIEHVHFGDARLATALAGYSRTTLDAYDGVPLAELSESARGRCLEDIVRRIDEVLNPELVFQAATGGLGIDGRRLIRSCAPYDWLRGGVRVECKSSKLCWCESMQRWQVRFVHIKLFPSKVSGCTQFDDLLLALYTPRGVYVIRHNQKFGISSCGREGHVHGCGVFCRGSVGQKNWSVALDCILDKFVDSSCDIFAFVSWE